jgi:hypothetical protein
MAACNCIGPPGNCPCIRRNRGDYDVLGDPRVGVGVAIPDPSYFGSDIAKLTEERGSVYGPPRVDFDRAQRLIAVVNECPDPLARHAMMMICVKLARLIQTPSHKDSWLDIAGYSKCGEEVTR